MAMSDAAHWLHEALLDLCSDSQSSLQLEAEVVSSLVSYCEIASPADAQQYLYSIVGGEKIKDIAAEYVERRGGVMPSDVFTFQDSREEPKGYAGMHAYMKPRENETWSAGSKKVLKPVKQKTDITETRPNATPTAQTMKTGPPVPVKAGKQKGRKGGKGISLAEAAEGLALFPRGGPCNCQASRHKLVNNCLGCGKIVCEQEGEGPCNFCGALVLKEGSDYAGLGGVTLPPANEAEAAAQAFKDRLVDFDRTATQRTTVIDDQSDYFEIDGNAWLSDKEKQLLRQRQQDEERAEEERRKRVIVTIDLLGRKVVMADKGDGKENAPFENLILAGDPFENKEASTYRIKPNPLVAHNPVYVGPKGPNSTKNEKRLINHLHGMILDKTGRVQHDDPIIEAVIGQQLGDVHTEGRDAGSNKGWHGPTVRGTGILKDKDEAECMLDMPKHSKSLSSRGTERARNAGKSSFATEAELDPLSRPLFDLCLPGAQREDGREAVVLAPSLLAQKQAERARAPIWTNTVLMPGMVLLKGWLSMDEQVEIVKECQMRGTGSGGFYQPTFGDGRHMHLQMMCLGNKHWEATSNRYVPSRAQYDNATPPEIPPTFSDMVKVALQKAQDLAQKAGGRRLGRNQVEGELPDMSPTVCIVNFYEQSGLLGMHQDKDETSESLQRGAPVVSFSLGDFAEFCYGKERDLEKAEKVTLESGDVLVFGGPARMIFHGVTRIIPKSAPKELVNKTNLRPGRLNLTFREL